jgi:hypothetical protein
VQVALSVKKRTTVKHISKSGLFFGFETRERPT